MHFPSPAQYQPKRQPLHALNMIQRMQITSAVFFTVLRGRLRLRKESMEEKLKKESKKRISYKNIEKKYVYI